MTERMKEADAETMRRSLVNDEYYDHMVSIKRRYWCWGFGWGIVLGQVIGLILRML